MMEEEYGRKEHLRAFLAYPCQDEDQPTTTGFSYDISQQRFI
jgi:hypothetical protein